MEHDFLGCSSGKFPGAKCSKFRWENEMVPFRKLKKTRAVIRGDAFFYYFRL